MGGEGGAKADKADTGLQATGAPGSQADRGNTERLWRLLRKQQGKVVICGDFNLPKVDRDRGWSKCAGELRRSSNRPNIMKLLRKKRRL